MFIVENVGQVKNAKETKNGEGYRGLFLSEGIGVSGRRHYFKREKHAECAKHCDDNDFCEQIWMLGLTQLSLPKKGSSGRPVI